MKRAFVIIMLLFIGTAYAQDPKLFVAKADKLLSRNDYENALPLYMQAMEILPDDALINFKVGLCHLHSEKKTKSVQYLEKAYSINPKVDLDIEYHLGLAYQYDHQYGKAMDFFQQFKTKNKRLADIAEHKIQECVIGDS